MWRVYFDSYDTLGRTLHAILNTHEFELDARRLLAEYEWHTGARLNVQHYSSVVRCRDADELISSFSEIIRVRRTRDGATVYSAVITNEFVRRARELILSRVPRRDPLLPADVVRLTNLKKEYARWKQIPDPPEAEDRVADVRTRLLDFLVRGGDARRGGDCSGDGGVAYDEVVARFRRDVFSGEAPSKKRSMLHFLLDVPGIVVQDGRVFAGNPPPRRRSTFDESDPTEGGSDCDESAAAHPRRLSPVESFVAKFKRRDDRCMPAGAALSAERKQQAVDMMVASLRICGRNAEYGRVSEKVDSERGKFCWHHVRVLDATNPDDLVLEVLDRDPLPYRPVEVEPLPLPLDLKGQVVLVRCVDRLCRGVILTHPVLLGRSCVEVRLVDLGIDIVVDEEDVYGLPLGLERSVARVQHAKLLVKDPETFRWDDSSVDVFRRLLTGGPEGRALVVHVFPDKSWLVDLFLCEENSDQWWSIGQLVCREFERCTEFLRS